MKYLSVAVNIKNKVYCIPKESHGNKVAAYWAINITKHSNMSVVNYDREYSYEKYFLISIKAPLRAFNVAKYLL